MWKRANSLGGGSSISSFTKVAEKSGRMNPLTYSNAVVGRYYTLTCMVSGDSSSMTTSPFAVSGADIIGQNICPKDNWGSNIVRAASALIKATSTTITVTQTNATKMPCYGAAMFEIG